MTIDPDQRTTTSPAYGTGASATGYSTTTAPPQGYEVRSRSEDTFGRQHVRSFRETKPSFLTTELWLTLAGVAALILAYNFADDASLDLWRMCLLATMGGMAYVVSRGLAKSGSRDRYDDD